MPKDVLPQGAPGRAQFEPALARIAKKEVARSGNKDEADAAVRVWAEPGNEIGASTATVGPPAGGPWQGPICGCT